MLDFFKITAVSKKKGVTEIYPKFIIKKSLDLMIRGGDFYAIWNENTGLWSTEEEVALYLIDLELDKFAEDYKKECEDYVKVLHMWDADSGMVDKWHKYCQKQMRDNYHSLDDHITFSNDEIKKEDYVSKKINYPLVKGPIPAFDELIGTLYNEEERRKIEWAIGCIVSGDSVDIQKFLVLYGSAGTGKSTVLNIIQMLFDGYYSVFDAKALGQANNSFALESFKSNPLVAIQHDGDLSKIEDNTRLNSIVSHELMTVNEKFKSAYSSRFHSFLFMGTNKPVRITDAKSGILRRLIDVSPSGKKVNVTRYKELVEQIKFELGGIAWHCREIYLEDPGYFDTYVPTSMIGATNDFYNFVIDSYEIFKENDGVSLKSAWELYRQYCDEAKVYETARLNKRAFQEELKNYFKNFEERVYIDGDTRIRNYYSGFIIDKFRYKTVNEIVKSKKDGIIFDEINSIFDEYCSDCMAQYANSKESPTMSWDKVETTVKDIDTSKLHYVRLPENHIVIDFDIKGEDGKKSLKKNLKEAEKWPPTYAELSKSGEGIHLHYIYNGDVEKLSRIYDDNIEIKVFTGKSSLRRMLTKCNNLPIATITGGLPMKEEKKVVNFGTIKNEANLRAKILKNLNKEYTPYTSTSISLILKDLDDAYNSGIKYDVSDLYEPVYRFAMRSTNQSDICIKKVNQMKFKSEEDAKQPENDIYVKQNDEDDSDVEFYDIEVYPNLFVVAHIDLYSEKPTILYNPLPATIENLLKKKLVGFNNRRYDNHIMYYRMMGYDNDGLFRMSQNIINHGKGFLGEAYNASYTDIYDYSTDKMSLKKWEIKLHIHHQEMDIPWDKPVPEELWKKVGEYCGNDVIATREVWKATSDDFIARKIIVDICKAMHPGIDVSVNDTTNGITTKIIFGNERHPELVYTDLSELFPGYEYVQDEKGVWHNMYRGEDMSHGGLVRSNPGIWENTPVLDVNSMHPTSIVELNLFGEYTKNYKALIDVRLMIKHKDFDSISNMWNGVLNKYLNDKKTIKNLSTALKIPINSAYGLTSAKFDNPLRDPRNKNNIVALRGALFMKTLMDEVEARGFEVAHIKTDSIKIPNCTPELMEFVMEFGKKYGYTFEYESLYEKMCLVNDAVYIAKYADDDINGEHRGEWTATGTRFQVPYVFKTLFSKEPIEFYDMCVSMSVQTSLYLDFNEEMPEDKHNYHFVGKVGMFTPVVKGSGGGILYRLAGENKYNSATGSKGYRWMESEMVKNLHKESEIDKSYFVRLVDEAIASIEEYGDAEAFMN